LTVVGRNVPRLLVIDDEPSILHAFQRAFRPPGVELLTAATAAAGLKTLQEHRPDVVVLDIQLPDQSGLDTFRQIHQLDPRIPVIFITGHATTDVAIQAMKLGAFEFLLKPVDLAELRALVEKGFAISQLMQIPVVVADQEPAAVAAAVAQPSEVCDVLVGRCPAMQAVYKAMGRVAAQDVTVLILGESGTGKELVARAIYRHSRRAMAPFLAISCAAIPETLLESELFGHEKGAFTGADRKRIGKFEQCTGGTLFLDEVGDMSPMTQTRLLRVLQEQRFERVGGNETIATDVRILAATNRDLERLVEQAQFRSDLYYRLAGFTIRLPPLRERLEDLPVLVDHFLRRFNVELGKDVQRVAPEALEVLAGYPWPGNLRELQSILKQALLHATGSVLLVDFLPAAVRSRGKEKDKLPPASLPDLERFINARIEAGSQALHGETLAQMERQLITRVLAYTGGNQLQAATILGITRGSLRKKIRSLGIVIERLISIGAKSEQGAP
jgi:two-component system nitrogen regulation response regulator GlnG